MTNPWPRRRFLSAAGGTSLAFGLLTPAAVAHPSVAAASTSEDFDVLRTRWRDVILGTGFRPTVEPFRTRLAALGEEAAALQAAMEPAQGSLWPDAVYADPEPDTDAESYGHSGKIQVSYSRLRTMATAYAQPGTGRTGDAGLRESVLTGLEHLHAQVYNAGQERYGNWYSWQIGGPQALLDSCTLLFDHIPGERLAGYLAAVDHFVPDSAVAEYRGTSTGANRVDLCRVLILRGILGRDDAKVALGRDALSPVFPYVTGGDGLYTDGSFVQHRNIAYTGSYGAVFLGGLGALFALLADSPWEVTDPNRQIIFDSVEDAFAPFLFNGLAMDGVAGRAISRGLSAGAGPGTAPQDDHVRGHAIVASIALLAQGASEAEGSRWRGMVKGWLRRERYRPVLTEGALDVPRLARLSAIENDTSVAPLPEPHENRVFAAMDRVTHRRPGWAASLSMASRRIAHYEYGNRENARGWHTGSGMLYWWGDDFGNGQYSDGFWPTADPYRLPGITVSRKRLSDGEGGNWGQPAPDADWVGGATDGTYAAVGQHLRGLSSTLTARKSWFFLDDAVVCLGAGIGCADGTGVESVVDHRNLGAGGDPALVVDDVTQPGSFPSSGTFDGAGWAHLEGHGGYVFPGGGTLHALREERTGAWSDINGGGSEQPVTRRYQTLWFEHGTDPRNAAYRYVLLPGADRHRTKAYAASAPGRLTVLANTPEQQGVHVRGLGFTGVTFWKAGTVGELTADAPCAVVVRVRDDGTAVVCVADPPRGARSLTLTWHRPVSEVLSRPKTLATASTGRALTCTFQGLDGTGGVTQRMTVRLG